MWAWEDRVEPKATQQIRTRLGLKPKPPTWVLQPLSHTDFDLLGLTHSMLLPHIDNSFFGHFLWPSRAETSSVT